MECSVPCIVQLEDQTSIRIAHRFERWLGNLPIEGAEYLSNIK